MHIISEAHCTHITGSDTPESYLKRALRFGGNRRSRKNSKKTKRKNKRKNRKSSKRRSI